LLLAVAGVQAVWAGDTPAIPAESAKAAILRHERVAERRRSINILCHRGASVFAHENTLEAYRATFELGGDGNEIDIRKTKDGMLVCFHDDMLDQRLFAYGDMSDYTWAELQQFQFRAPGSFGEATRIPTFIEVLALHRKYAGLMHLDIKQPGLDTKIADLLTRMDMWDHVAYSNTENGGVLLTDPRLKLRRYKAELYSDRSEVFPDKIAAALKLPGDDIIVDDPRGVAVALGRKIGKLSTQPVDAGPRTAPATRDRPSEKKLIHVLLDADDWNHIAETADQRAASARRIVARAEAADQLLQIRASSPDAFNALETRVRQRSLHKDWGYHGVDGAAALRALILLKAPNAPVTARFALWRDDPALEPLLDPKWHTPRAVVDWRVKNVVFAALKQVPSSEAEKLCRDYLALSDEEAARIGPSYFDEAAGALLASSPRTETALMLLRHRLQPVRGRAILSCLAQIGEQWAHAALDQAAPFAFKYRIPIVADNERTTINNAAQ